MRTAVGSNDSLGYYGGWALIVLYEHAGKPFRRLMVFDGEAGYVSSSNTASVTVSGLLTPPEHDFTAYMGALVWEGDGGISGDKFRLEAGDVVAGDLSDALSPANNFWNSGITRLGVRFSAKDPDYVNQFAVDLKLVDISRRSATPAVPQMKNSSLDGSGAIIPSSATLSFTSSQDAYFPHVLLFVSDLYFPDLVSSFAKKAYNAAGVELKQGDIIRRGEEIEYRISFENTGLDGATKVVVSDPIPQNTTYLPGSLKIINNVPGESTGPMTDASGDDQADFDAVAKTVRFRIGSGATATQGGLVRNKESALMSFKVRVNNDAPADVYISNYAGVAHNSQTIPQAVDI